MTVFRLGRRQLLLILLLSPLAGHNASAAALYTAGHADFGLAYDGGVLDFHFHGAGAFIDGQEVADERYPISNVVTLVTSETMLNLPVDFPPLGALLGQTIWMLPETQFFSLPFLGLATEELNSADWGNLTISLGAVTSPSAAGNFALWQSGTFGETLLHMSTADPAVDLVIMQAGTHSHYNWGFTEPGAWQIEMTASGNHRTDGLKSSTQTLAFHVVPEPSAMVLACMASIFMCLIRRRYN